MPFLHEFAYQKFAASLVGFSEAIYRHLPYALQGLSEALLRLVTTGDFRCIDRANKGSDERLIVQDSELALVRFTFPFDQEKPDWQLSLIGLSVEAQRQSPQLRW